MEIEDIYLGAARLINELIIEEFRKQGHSLTGEWESSLTNSTNKTSKTATLVGMALAYGMIVNKGVEPDKITKSMIPGLIQYFMKRGLGQAEATIAAGATFAKWKQEGMSTQASKRYSETGARQNFIEAAFIGNEPAIDGYMTELFDFSFNERYLRTKDETI